MQAAGRTSRTRRWANGCRRRCRPIGRRRSSTKRGRIRTCRRSAFETPWPNTSRANRPMRTAARSLWIGFAGGVAAMLLLATHAPTAQSENRSELDALAARASTLERELGLLEDQDAVKKL